MRRIILLCGLLLATVWAFWPTLADMAHKWSTDDHYTHGYLVPVFAGVLLWLRRDQFDVAQLGTSWWGIVPIVASAVLRLASAYLNLDWLDGLAFLLCLSGICLVVGGPHVIRWAFPSVGFLVFMVPLPYTVERAMSLPLQRLGTAVSVYVMQTLGLPALSQGNIIEVGEHQVKVAEACSGLRMLVVFFALSAAVALLIDRSIWTRFIVLASAVPIALISNITRITVTGILYELVSSHVANFVFHDLAGWLMMPLGLGLLWCELALLSRLFHEDEDEEPLDILMPKLDSEIDGAVGASEPQVGITTT